MKGAIKLVIEAGLEIHCFHCNRYFKQAQETRNDD